MLRVTISLLNVVLCVRHAIQVTLLAVLGSDFPVGEEMRDLTSASKRFWVRWHSHVEPLGQAYFSRLLTRTVASVSASPRDHKPWQRE